MPDRGEPKIWSLECNCQAKPLFCMALYIINVKQTLTMYEDDKELVLFVMRQVLELFF